MGVECPSDFGANLVQIWCNTLCNDTHDITRYSRYQTVLLKLEEIISAFGRNLQKMLCVCRAFFVISWRTMNCPRGMNWLTPWIAPAVYELPTALMKRAIQFMKSKISNREAVGFNSWRLAVNSSLKEAVQFVRNWSVLFTFCRFYGIIQLIDKLEFVGKYIL